MKPLFIFLWAAALAAASTVPAFADAVFTRTQNPLIDAGVVSDQGPGSTDVQQSSDFMLSSTTTLTSVSWTGFHSAFLGPVASFDVDIYDTEFNSQGTLLYSQTIGQGAFATYIETVGTGLDTFSHESYHGDINFTALANTPYYLSIVANVQSPDDWFWTLSYPANEFVFTLYDTPSTPPPSPPAATPEPSSLMLTGTAMITLASAVRRRLARREAKS